MDELQAQETLLHKARELYEASRKSVSGRPSWDRLDPNDPYDMGMRHTAITKARLALGPDYAE